eukprot:6180328-Pleurochrysis_carterae.AAC.2
MSVVREPGEARPLGGGSGGTDGRGSGVVGVVMASQGAAGPGASPGRPSGGAVARAAFVRAQARLATASDVTADPLDTAVRSPRRKIQPMSLQNVVRQKVAASAHVQVGPESSAALQLRNAFAKYGDPRMCFVALDEVCAWCLTDRLSLVFQELCQRDEAADYLG